MEVREFIKTIKEELPDFLPDGVYQDITIDEMPRLHCISTICMSVMRTVRIWDSCL